MILTDAERTKFAEYLEQDTASSEALIRQMEAMPGLPEAVVRNMRAEVAAAKMVARRLRNTTAETVGG